MKDSEHETTAAQIAPHHRHGHKPALQVICLGNSGGPSEDNVTGLLVRSIGSQWARGSLLAVDAGSHLAPIIRILEKHFPSVCDIKTRTNSISGHAAHADTNGAETPGLSEDLAKQSISPATSPSSTEEDLRPEPTLLKHGPFAGLTFPNGSARANALHILRLYVSTYLITHPHLDHLSGFTINTAAFNGTTRPKTVAALPSTVEAIKRHIFNDVIWPNLTDEDGGVGFVTFQRLKEGGDLMVGEGGGRGYIDVCDGLGVRAWKVSHGVCTKSPPSHHHRGSISSLPAGEPQPLNYSGPVHDPNTGRKVSISAGSQFSVPPTPGGSRPSHGFFGAQTASPRMAPTSDSCVVDSTAYFIRDCGTFQEVLIFGDVEPDSISLSPRNHVVWLEAARKIAYNVLGGIFIECSYDDSQADAVLFGHLNPRHLIAELKTLATMVIDARAQRLAEKYAKKRKRSAANGTDTRARSVVEHGDRKRSSSHTDRKRREEIRRSSVPDHTMIDAQGMTSSPAETPTHHLHAHFAPWAEPHMEPLSPMGGPAVNHGSSIGSQTAGGGGGGSGDDAAHAAWLHARAAEAGPPLNGVKIVVIHVKDTLRDGPHASESILAQLNEHEAQLKEDGEGLGCEFVIAQSGESYLFG